MRLLVCADTGRLTEETRLLRLLCLASLLIAGCAETAQDASKNELTRISWDLSADRNANKFDWFDFDPSCGCIEGTHWLELKFDNSRSFKGKTDLITIHRDGTGTRPLNAVSINLTPMTDEEVIRKLETLADDWGLPSDRLESQLPGMLEDSLKRGILLYERGRLDIDVEFCSSFDKERPFSLTISWYWTEN